MASGKFSGALQLTGLDDFIAPSQECIKPMMGGGNESSARGTIEIEGGKYFEVSESGEKEELQKAQITLADCLACSGCVTSAESILIQAQSTEEFIQNTVKNKGEKVVVVTVAPQVRASFAMHFSTTIATAMKKIVFFLKKHCGVDYVFDSSFGREITLLEKKKEFLDKYDQLGGGKGGEKGLGGGKGAEGFPVLCSACPGWVCYAEKRHGDYILPHISKVKSPQQIMGVLAKKYFAKKLNVDAKNIYHTSLMPCFDKKLEASRQDFVDEVTQNKEVDCVVTSMELVELMEEMKVGWGDLEEIEIDRELSNVDEKGNLYGNPGGSGGFAEMIFREVARERWGKEVEKVEFVNKRNQDMKVATLKVDGKIVLNVAIANGFRNIQNLLRTAKQGKCPYHYVEVMACPSGCLNGGAQIPLKNNNNNNKNDKLSAKKLLTLVSDVYHEQEERWGGEGEGEKVGEGEGGRLGEVYEWAGGKVGSGEAAQFFHTQYHNIPQENPENALAIKW